VDWVLGLSASCCIRYQGRGIITARHTLFHGNDAFTSGPVSSRYEIDADLMFGSAAAGDYCRQEGSPAIDAGRDLRGSARIATAGRGAGGLAGPGGAGCWVYRLFWFTVD
jgi:hypothetical protein